MDTIRKYIEWIERVRTLDPDCQKLSAFYQKGISLGISEAEDEATDLEKQLFLPPNPWYRIQPFENRSGTLISKVEAQFFIERANEMGFVKKDEYVQGGVTRVRCYTINDPINTLYIGESAKKPDPQIVRFKGEDGKLHVYNFDNYGEIWICAYGNNRFRISHDWAQPFLELVDNNKIPSVISDRENCAWASNISMQNWEVIR